jgi:cbb3-type cytochrome oxidase subunit 3
MQIKRDSLLEAYFAHRDTITVRTWVNVVTSNKYLEEIRKTDSILLAGKNPSVEKTYQMVNDLQEELDKLTRENQGLQAQSRIRQHDTSFENTTFLFSILVAALFLILFVILFFGYSGARRKAAMRDKESRNYLAELNEARDVVEKMQTTESDLAHKLNLLEAEYRGKFKVLLTGKSAIEDEKLLLENQLIEVKKAWDHEVMKRMEAESVLVLAQKHDLLKINAEKEQQRIIDLEDKIRLLEIENIGISKVLNKTQAALEGESTFRKSAEDSLNNLISQLEQGGLLKPGNRDLLHITEEMKANEQLLLENKTLTEELEKIRFKYSLELKGKFQLQQDLDLMLSRLKSDISN